APRARRCVGAVRNRRRGRARPALARRGEPAAARRRDRSRRPRADPASRPAARAPGREGPGPEALPDRGAPGRQGREHPRLRPARGRACRGRPQGLVAAAAFFDLDRTLLRRSSALALAPAFRAAGLISRRQLAKAAAWQLLFMARGASHEAVRRAAEDGLTILRGFTPAEMSAIVADSMERVLRP